MTKNEIIAEILGNPLVLKQLSLKVANTLADGTKIYVIELLEALGNSAKQRIVPFYVLNDGEINETAYYKNAEFATAIQTFMDRLKPLLKQHNASIIEQGETWALCETNTIIDNAGVYSIQKNKYFVVDGTPLSITPIG